MQKQFFLITFFFACLFSFGQDAEKVMGVIVNTADDKPLESVNIVNLNQVLGTTTNSKGEFEITAKVNDTLHLSYLGFKSINEMVGQSQKLNAKPAINHYKAKGIDLSKLQWLIR